MGARAEPNIAPLLEDGSEDVRCAVVENLGHLRSVNPQLRALYRDLFDPEQVERHSDRLRKAACVALRLTGNIDVGYGEDAEAMLCRALTTRGRKVLGLRLGERIPFSPAVRGLLCGLLGQFGGEKARDVLREATADPETSVAAQAQRALEQLERQLRDGPRPDGGQS
jgi:HEAT repeat protein